MKTLKTTQTMAAVNAEEAPEIGRVSGLEQRQVGAIGYFTISLFDATFACLLPAASVA
jgi:hypothetical protein